MDTGPEPMAETEARIVRAQARRVHVRAGMLGLLAMLGAWIAP